MMKTGLHGVALGLALGLIAIRPVQAQEGDAARGRALFQRQCQSCHQIAQPRNGVGPHLQGVLGRGVGAVDGFTYSPALRALGGSWTSETLESYLANPAGLARGTRMAQRVASEQDRRDIIAYLTGP